GAGGAAGRRRRRPGCVGGDHPEPRALDALYLAPIPLEGVEHQLDPRGERDELVRAGADRRLFVAVVADLLDVFLGDDPASPGRAAVEGQEIRPRLFQLEAEML